MKTGFIRAIILAVLLGLGMSLGGCASTPHEDTAAKEQRSKKAPSSAGAEPSHKNTNESDDMERLD